jgi:hypothetical protein
MKLDWTAVREGMLKESGNLTDWIGRTVGGIGNAVTSGIGNAVTSTIPGAGAASYLAGGGLMKDLSGVATAALPLVMRMGKKKTNAAAPDLRGMQLGGWGRNLLTARPGEVHSMGSPKLGEFGLSAKVANVLDKLNQVHMEKIKLRQAIQNARVYGKTPNRVGDIQKILSQRNLRFTPPPLPTVKAANLMTPTTLKTILISRATNDVLDGIQSKTHAHSTPLEDSIVLSSSEPEIQKMLANPQTREYLKAILTGDTNSTADEKNIHT